MKLAIIEKEHLISAATEMERNMDNSWAEYWVQLDNGKEYQFKRLIMEAYGIATGMKISNDFFQSNDNYRSYIERKFGYKVIFKIPQNIPFFSAEDFDFFSNYIHRQYRKGDKELEAVGKKIKDEIYKKTNAWARLLNLKDWEIELDNIWQVSGNFKSYSWIRIYKKKDKGSKVYFTIGAGGAEKVLFYRIDYQRRKKQNEDSLSKNQIDAFNRVLEGTNAFWNIIKSDELSDWNWERLRDVTVEFIGKYEYLYDEAIEAVKNASALTQLTSPGSLEEFPIPVKAFDKIPDKQYSFKGVIVDYDAENENAKKIGEAGEELVILKERKTLADNGHLDLVEKVKKVKDGEGYDILSFDLNRNRKFIEVKTTSGTSMRPFLMTDNEWEFMRQYSENYHLYRIYDFDRVTSRGKYFCISGNLENRVYIKPKQMEVFLRTEEAEIKSLEK